jgi:hypothetical protein
MASYIIESPLSRIAQRLDFLFLERPLGNRKDGELPNLR